MARRKTVKSLEPYWHNENISLVYELKWKTGVIVPGDLIKIKGDRNTYRFTRLVVNHKTGKEWIDVLNVTLGGWASFYLNRISGPVVKKSRQKKN